MDTEPHIIVVDDHADIRDPLARYLVKNGFRVSSAANAEKMREMMKAAAPDLIVLDVMMPGEDGLSLCRHLRETTEIPVILLTAMAEDTDRIVGLEVGADDYVTKPFNPRELLARIKAVLRRTRAVPKRDEPLPSTRLRFAHWILDDARRELVDDGGTTVPLSTLEHKLLRVLLQRPGMVLNREQLLDLTAGRDAHPFDRSIDNQVSRLRKKLERDPKKPAILQTVWGGGYKLAVEVTPA